MNNVPIVWKDQELVVNPISDRRNVFKQELSESKNSELAAV